MNDIEKKEYQKNYQKEYRLKNKQKIQELNKNYREKNKTELSLYKKEYYEKNKLKINTYRKEYCKNNKDKIRAYHNNYCIEKNKTNKNFRLTKILRSRIYSAVKSINLNSKYHSEELLGGDIKTIKAHIESLFKSGMNWDNQGQWHIDHILPIGICKTEEEIMARCHYKNLQPLWAIDNLKKGAKIFSTIEN